MNESEEKGTEQVDANAQNIESPARPVRMKWGRVVEEPPEESAPPPSEEQNTSKPLPPPKPDPRIEALRERLAREEQAEVEARMQREREKKEIEARAAVDESASAREGDKRLPSPKCRARTAKRRATAKKALASQKSKRSIDASERCMNASDVRRESEENARMREELEREELEREELLKRIRRKRRREKLRSLGLAILDGIWMMLRKIRISKKLVIGLLVTVLLSGLSAVILGNLLKARVGTLGDDAESTDTPETEAETVSSARGLEIPALNAGIVSLEGATAKTLRSEAQRFANAGVTAVSLILRNEDGQLLFSAQTDDALGIETEDGGLLRISEILEPFLSREIYVSCILPMRYFADGDDYSRSVLYAYETALLCEVAEAGAQEVILLDCDGLFDLTEEVGTNGEDAAFSAADAVRELTEISRAVNERAPVTAVGIAFSPEFLATRNSDRYLGSIVEAFDLLLLDLRSAEASDDLYAEVSAGVSDHLYFILRYSMRVLIPQGSAEAVTRVSVGNWQEGTLPIASMDESE